MEHQSNLDYITPERAEALGRLQEVLDQYLPKGFSCTSGQRSVSYCVPHERYPAGYHCDPSQLLPFISIIIQKNFIAMYHMGLYANPELLAWFTEAYPKHARYKLDMGKSCIRFKKTDDIPYALIAELAAKMEVSDWIDCYETQLKLYKK